MKKLLVITILFIFLFSISGCTRFKDAKTESFSDANVIIEYLDKARIDGFKYYSFIDLRASIGAYGKYSEDLSYRIVRIGLFDSVSWAGGNDKGKESLNNYLKSNKRKKDYPIILIDYDGKWVKDVADYLNSLGYNNVKYFTEGYFGDNGFIMQVGENSSLIDRSDPSCDC